MIFVWDSISAECESPPPRAESVREVVRGFREVLGLRGPTLLDMIRLPPPPRCNMWLAPGSEMDFLRDLLGVRATRKFEVQETPVEMDLDQLAAQLSDEFPQHIRASFDSEGKFRFREGMS